MPDIDLRALLEEVPYEALHAYFETNNIPLPKDGSKGKLIDLLMTPEYKKDVRAVMLVELKAESRLIKNRLKDNSEKIEKLSAVVEKEHVSIESWKNTFQYTSLGLGVVISVLGFFGLNTISDLKKTSEESKTALIETQNGLKDAQGQLKEGDKIIEGYRGFVLNEVSKSVSSVMNQVSTNWFSESDIVVAEELEVYIDNLKKFDDSSRAEGDIKNSNISKREVVLIIDFLELLKPIAEAPLDVKDANDERFYQAEQKWSDLYEKWEKALNDNSISNVTGKTYLAYISNIQGIFSHVRYSAAVQREFSQDAMSYLESAQKAFDTAKKYRSVYAPASSNLGVTLLNMLNLKMKNGFGGGTISFTIAESEFIEIDKLLTRPAALKNLSPTTRARILNNLAMNAMYYALSFDYQRDFKKAEGYLEQADRYLDEVLDVPGSPAVLAVSKAEVSLYRAILKAKQNQDLSEDVMDAKKWMQEAVLKNYPFKNNFQYIVDSSPVFSTLRKDFPSVSEEIWKGVIGQR